MVSVERACDRALGLHRRGYGVQRDGREHYAAGGAGHRHPADLARGLRVSERIEAGMVGLNRGLVSDPAAPFGGVKESGLGREGGVDGLLAFTESKYIAVSW